MSFIAAACSVLTAAAAVVLLRRGRGAVRDGRDRLRAAAAPDDLPARLLRLVQRSLDAGLLAAAGPGGLADVAVRAREQRDPYQNAAQLLDWLARAAAARDHADVSGLVK